MAIQDLIMQIMSAGGGQAPQGAMGGGNPLSALMSGINAGPAPPPMVSQEEYDSIMKKVAKGQPRTDAETQKLQQFNMQRQSDYFRANPPQKPNERKPIPTHEQMGGLPRAIYNPFGTLADAMQGH